MEDVIEAPHLLVRVRDPEDAGVLRRTVAKTAANAGIAAQLLPRVELVATELGTNIVRHAADRGHVLSRAIGHGEWAGFELIAVDSGPGIADLGAALSGAAGAVRGLGCGLAGVRRLASEFDAFSATGSGTVVLARLLPDRATSAPRWSGVSIPAEGQSECGDAWAVADDAGVLTVLVVDGLGHGPDAAIAAAEAVRCFAASNRTALVTLAESIHHAMRSTRGGAVALCRLDPASHRAEFIGVGNIGARLLTRNRSQTLVSLGGTMGVGLAPPKMHQVVSRLEEGATLVMTSDGVRGEFSLAEYPGLLAHDPSVVAAVIHRDNARGTDDATVVVVQLGEGERR